MGHENGDKQRPTKRRHVQGMLDETDPVRPKEQNTKCYRILGFVAGSFGDSKLRVLAHAWAVSAVCEGAFHNGQHSVTSHMQCWQGTNFDKLCKLYPWSKSP